MSVFQHPEFDAHEEISFFCDEASGLRAIIAVHNTHLGHALGGCRMMAYASDEAALNDVLRLSRGMTYKAALAGLPQGGGKSVILGDARSDKTPAMMRAMGRCVDRLGGRYIIAEDSGTNVEDMRLIAQETRYVGGIADAASVAAGRTGDPSPATAQGTFIGIKAAVRHALGREHLDGLKIAIQGVGAVGGRLAGHLAGAGAKLFIADVHPPSLARCAEATGATIVPLDAIHALDVDVFSPCALGASINDSTLPALRARVVAGAANNQLAEPRHGEALRAAGILYAPDYVINAGGIIDIHYEGPGYDPAIVDAHLERIGRTLTEIFERSRATHRPTGEIADRLAEERFRRG